MDVWEIGLFVRDDIVATSTSSGHSHVEFNFFYNLSVYEYYDNVLLRINELPSIRRSSIHIGLEKCMSYEDSLEKIDQQLRDWPILDSHEPCRREMIEKALDAANILLRSMSPQHNVLVIPLRVEVICHRIVGETHAMELMVRQSMEEDDSRMVPATDSSIESLKITATTSHEKGERCSICLEDFYKGCDVVSMPCSHIFHEDCIKEWLKSSHYCPICRFEMPTSS